MPESKTEFVGQLQRPGQRPENVSFIAKARPNLTTQERAAGIIWVNRDYDPGFVRRYGGVGDGVTDDTVALQTAINSGHRAQGHQEDTYLVSNVGTRTINSVANRYCILCPDNSSFHGNGCTVALANSDNSALFMNSTAGTTQNNNVELHDFIIDGNQANQTSPATGDMPCIFFHDVDRPRVTKITARNVRQYAGRFLSCTDVFFDDLFCEDSDGDGWSFGVELNSDTCIGGKIGRVHAEGCLGTYSGLVGNSIIMTCKDMTIDALSEKNCAAGLKIQDSSRNLSVGTINCTGNTNGTGNSGLKIQGNNAAAIYPDNISIGSVACYNKWGAGLFISTIGSVSIGQYSGKLNGAGGGTGSENYDVDIDQTNGGFGNLIQIGSIKCENNNDEICVRIGGAGRCQIGQIALYNPVGVGVQIESTGRVDIGSITHVDPGTVTTTYVVRVTGDCRGQIRSIESSLAHSTSQSRVRINTGIYNFIIGSIRLGSTDTLEGVVALTNASTTTSVTCGHIWRDYVGGTADYFHPIIQLVPVDSTSAALGNMRATVTDGSSGTGFTINHASATTGDDVFWKVLGWKTISQAVA